MRQIIWMELDENLRYHGTDEADEDSPTNNQSPSSELNPDKQSPSIVVPEKYDMALCFEVPQRNVLEVVEPIVQSNHQTSHHAIKMM